LLNRYHGALFKLPNLSQNGGLLCTTKNGSVRPIRRYALDRVCDDGGRSVIMAVLAGIGIAVLYLAVRAAAPMIARGMRGTPRKWQSWMLGERRVSGKGHIRTKSSCDRLRLFFASGAPT
jgi:hypothetical protein